MTTNPTDPSAPAARLSRWTKFIYGLGEFGPSVAGGTIIPFYFLFFLTDVAGLRPGIAGSLLLVARIWDAVNDPLVGVLSDRTRTRLGRRRPFILIGAVPLAATYILLWIVPTGLTGNALALYYLGAYFLYDLFMTLTAGPFYALMPELSLDSDERTSIVTYRMATSIITGLLAAVALPLVFNVAPSMRVGFGWAAVGVGICSALPYLLIVACVRERPDFQAPPRISILESLQSVLRCRPFWLAMLVNWLAWLAIAIVEAVFAYYVVYWSGIPEEDSAIILAVILGSAILFLPLVNLLAARLEKKWAFVAATGTWAATHVLLWFVPQATLVPVYVIGVLAGFGVSSAHILPTSMAADVMEALEVETGERQEGVFGGVSTFLQKLGNSVALLAIGWVLDLTGYQAGVAVQSPATLTGLRVLVSWVPLALLALAILCAAAFPITRRVHRDLVAQAERVRARRALAEQPTV
jgi:GPH family glycoside/pentoside/hexuronide:cation symporter